MFRWAVRGCHQLDALTCFQINSAQAVSFIPRQIKVGKNVLLDVSDQIKHKGSYLLRLEDEVVAHLSYNYNIKESSLSYYSPDELEENHSPQLEVLKQRQQEDFSQVISQIERGRFLWKWSLLFCLVFLGIEQMLLRFWKT